MNKARILQQFTLVAGGAMAGLVISTLAPRPDTTELIAAGAGFVVLMIGASWLDGIEDKYDDNP